MPCAGQAAPAPEAQEHELTLLRRELQCAEDAELAALLDHEIARLHAQRDDLSAAARSELAATSSAPGFVQPIESLVRIATRSHSAENRIKLLERLVQMGGSEAQQLHASLSLAASYLEQGNNEKAQQVVEQALIQIVDEPALWLLLESIAAKKEDRELRKRATLGRAAHVRSPALRCLLLERLARLHHADGQSEAAYDALKQGLDEEESYRALHAWERMALANQDCGEAADAAETMAQAILSRLSQTASSGPTNQFPSEELTLARACAALYRAATYAIDGGDSARSLGLAERLTQIHDSSPLGWLLIARLAVEQGDPAERLRALAELYKRTPKDDEGRLFVATLVVLASREDAHDQDTRSAALEEVKARAPTSQAAYLLRWLESESAGPPQLAELLTAFFSSDSASSQLGTPVLVAASLCSLLSAGPEQAAAHLASAPLPTSDEEEPNAPLVSPLAAAWGTALAQATGNEDDAALYRSSLRSLLEDGSLDAARLDWAQVRHDFLQGRPPSSVNEAWPQMMLQLLSSPTNRAQALGQYLASNPAPEKKRAVAALGLLLSGPAQAAAPQEKEPLDLENLSGVDPLFVGASLGREPQPTQPRSEFLLQAAAHLTDPTLAEAWRLKALLAALCDGDEALAARAIDALRSGEEAKGSVNGTESTFAAMKPWLLLREAGDDPQACFQAMESSPPQRHHRLERLFLLAALDQVAFQREIRSLPDEAEASQGEILLRLLCAGSQNAHTFDEACEQLQLETIDRSARALLALARTAEADGAPHRLSERARDWAEAVLDDRAQLTVWVAARRAQEPSLEAQAMAELALARDDFGLLCACAPEQLSPSLRQRRQRAVQARIAELDARGSEQTSPASWPEELAELRWEAVEDAEPENEPSALLELSPTLDAQLEHPDAQLARLCAGYQYLAHKSYDDALTAFEPLVAVMAEDVTLCHGLYVAARQCSNAGLQAHAAERLAAASADEDTALAAELWEEAGALYQDKLSELDKAQRCFQAAWEQSPGRPLSFDRLYAFASSRKDRSAQVELLRERLKLGGSDQQRARLLWEQARHCRSVGRRAQAERALEELLTLEPDQLRGWALLAELHAMDRDPEKAARSLEKVALHPDTPTDLAERAGLFCCDLLEGSDRSADAVRVLLAMEGQGIESNETRQAAARALSTVGDWEQAYERFQRLNDDSEDQEQRLSFAKMMLAVQREHLSDSNAIKDAARRVLRDCPEHPAAVSTVIEHAFEPFERSRLLSQARRTCHSALQAQPLSPLLIQQFADLCLDCEDQLLERVALGIQALSGGLTANQSERLKVLRQNCAVLPNQALSEAQLADLAFLPSGSAPHFEAPGALLKLLAPYATQTLEPSLEALGVSSLQRIDEFSNHPLRQQAGTWAGAFSLADFELYHGGRATTGVRAVEADLPTLLVGEEVPSPLDRVSMAKIAVQLFSLAQHWAVWLNQPVPMVRAWVVAATRLPGLQDAEAAADNAAPAEHEDAPAEIARALADTLSPDDRQQLATSIAHLSQNQSAAKNADQSQLRASAPEEWARAQASQVAVFAYGDPSILRELPELMPNDLQRRNALLAQLIRFCLSPAFSALRRDAGLEGP